MSASIRILPLYADYFFDPVNKKPISKDWNKFKSSQDDFNKPLSAKKIDFSARDTSWFHKATHITSFILKTAAFSHLFYSFTASTIQRLTPSFLQARMAQLLPKDKMLEGILKYTDSLFSKVLSESAKSVGLSVFSKLLSVWACHTILRYITQRLVMLALYPAQSRIVKYFRPIANTRYLHTYRTTAAQELNAQGFIVRDVNLEKNGIRYSGLLIGHSETIENGQWALQATGLFEPIEHTAALFAKTYKECKFNTLIINGPAVGKSEGQATPQSMGDAQEIGLRFIEEALHAHKVVIAGRSLGGAAIGQAILKHDFQEGIKYLVVRQMTFDRASNVCGKIAGRISPNLDRLVAVIVRWSGCEMDSIAASKRLEKLGIPEVIVQASCREIALGELPTIHDFRTDEPILACASLGHTLIHEKVTNKKVFRCLFKTSHMADNAVTAAQPEIEIFRQSNFYNI